MNELHCTHTFHEIDNIHVFTVLQATHRAFAEWFGYMKAIYEALPPGEELRYILDYAADAPLPVKIIIQTWNHWMRYNPEPAPTRVAFLSNDGTVPYLMTTIINMLQPKYLKIIFLQREQTARAIEWLCDGSEIRS